MMKTILFGKLDPKRILPSKSESNATLFLLKNDTIAAEIWMEDELKSEAHLLLKYLKTVGKRTILLSGDKKEKCSCSKCFKN